MVGNYSLVELNFPSYGVADSLCLLSPTLASLVLRKPQATPDIVTHSCPFSQMTDLALTAGQDTEGQDSAT